MHRQTPASRRSRRRLIPRVDRLEGRALMALGGVLDPTFGGGLGYASGLPALGELQYINGSNQVVTVPFGVKGAGQTLPEPGDFDGSGKTEIGVYIPSTNSFEYLPASGGALASFPVGFTAEGPIIPVTSVVPLSLVGSPSVE